MLGLAAARGLATALAPPLDFAPSALQRCGDFEVPPGWAYDVSISLWNHSSWWKSGLAFRELRLEPVRAGRGESGETAARGPPAHAAASKAHAPRQQRRGPSRALAFKHAPCSRPHLLTCRAAP